MRVVLFNNGRAPDRVWSTVDEYAINLDAALLDFGRDESYCGLVWQYGPACGRFGSFYAHHSSGVHRCDNGNTLVTLGVQGIVFEVTRDLKEVWRYINPVENRGDRDAAAFVKQGDQRVSSKHGLFFTRRYSQDLATLKQRLPLPPGKYLEG